MDTPRGRSIHGSADASGNPRQTTVSRSELLLALFHPEHLMADLRENCASGNRNYLCLVFRDLPKATDVEAYESLLPSRWTNDSVQAALAEGDLPI